VEDKTVIKKIQELKSNIAKKREEFYAMCKTLDNLYNNQRPSKSKKKHISKDDVNPGRVFSETESIKGKMLDSIYSSPKLFAILNNSLSPDGYESVSKAVEKIVFMSKMKESFTPTLHNFILKGAGAYQILYQKETKLPLFRNINIENLFWDLDAETFEEVRYIIRAGVVSGQDISDMGGSYDIPKELSDKLKDKNNIELLEKDIEFLEYWSKSKVYTILDEKYLVRESENFFGFIPFVIIPNYTRDTITATPKGDIEPALSVFNAQIDNLNMMYDNNNIKNNRIFFYKEGALPANFKAVAGGVYPIKGGYAPREALYSPDIPDISTGATFLDGLYKSSIQDVTAQYDYSRGKQGSRQEFATTVITLTQNANIRVNMRLMVISNILEKALKNIIKFLAKEGVVKIEPEEIDTGFQILLNGGNIGESAKLAKVQKITQMIQTLSSLPEMVEAIKGRSLANEVIQLFGENNEEVLKSVDEIKKEKEKAEKATAKNAPTEGNTGGASTQIPENILSKLAGAQGGMG